jgi:hypothetical protein
MSTLVQQAFTNEIRNIRLEHDSHNTRIQRISASCASVIEKSWIRIPDKHLLGQTFEWEPPTQEAHLLHLLMITGTLLTTGKDDTIKIQFGKEKITLTREQATYIQVRENKAQWHMTSISPNKTNRFMATVDPSTRHGMTKFNRVVQVSFVSTFVREILK